MKTFWMFALAAALVAVCLVPAQAQSVISAKSGIISDTQGKVFLGDEAVENSATRFPEIKENAVVRTEEGRVEVLLTPGVFMHVGEHSSFKMLSRRLIDTRLELLTGSAVVSAIQIEKGTNITVVCKSGTVTLARAGHYRLDAEPGRIKVYAGIAEVQVGEEHIEVTAGRMLTFSGTSASAEKFDKNDTDALENWAQRRDQMAAMANLSAARQASYGYSGYSASGSGFWGFNPYYGMYTYIPGSGQFCDPFYRSYCYYSPVTVGRIYYQPPPQVYSGGNGGFGGSYPSMGSSSGGYSGAMGASSSSVGASAAAAGSSASSAASSAGSSSAGHGSAGGGGSSAGGGGGRGH